MSQFIAKVIISIAAVAGLFVATPALATAGTGTASLSASPSSGSYNVGETFTVTIRETSSGPVAGVQSDLRYDQAKLQCLGVDAAGSAFVQQYQNSCGGGAISIARTTQGTTVTGSQKIASVTFKALAGSGTTKLTFAGSSEILDDSVNNVCNSTCNEGAQAANFTLTTPPAPAQPTTPAPSAPATNNNQAPASNDKPANSVAVLDKSTGNDTPDQTATVAAINSEQTQPANADGQPAEVAVRNGWQFPWVTILALVGVAALVVGTLYVRKRLAAMPTIAAVVASKKKPAAAKKAAPKSKKAAPRKKPAAKK